jgi:hypothetical protein
MAPGQITFSRPVVVGLGVFAALMLGLLATSVKTLEDADRRRLVAHLDSAAQSAPRVEGMTRRLLSAQLDALGILKQSLAIQRETLRHAESLDRKTGPSASQPPVSATGP